MALQGHFSGVEAGQALALVGSAGGLEIAINRGDAATALGVEAGQRVTLNIAS